MSEMSNNDKFRANVLDWLNMKVRTNAKIADKVVDLVLATYQYAAGNSKLAEMLQPEDIQAKIERLEKIEQLASRISWHEVVDGGYWVSDKDADRLLRELIPGYRKGLKDEYNKTLDDEG